MPEAVRGAPVVELVDKVVAGGVVAIVGEPIDSSAVVVFLPADGDERVFARRDDVLAASVFAVEGIELLGGLPPVVADEHAEVVASIETFVPVDPEWVATFASFVDVEVVVVVGLAVAAFGFGPGSD